MDDIAFEMDVPKTLVEHWFRTDKYQAIPLPQYWHKLKEVLAIKSNEFDQQIMEWVTVDGVFEMANRCYDSRGLSPTIKACGDINVVVAE